MKRCNRSISEKDGDRTVDESYSSVEPSCVCMFKLYMYDYI